MKVDGGILKRVRIIHLILGPESLQRPITCPELARDEG
jgi:hypothetical protein